MGFFFYEIKNGKAYYAKEVRLAGYNLIYNILCHKGIIKSNRPYAKWHISEKDLIQMGIRQYNLSQFKKYIMIVDLKPSVKNNISLYKLTNIWGYSYETWTPIMIQLIPIYIDENALEVKFTKEKFPIPQDLNQREKVHTFLYLRGGTKEGNWNWGGRGFVSAALLWPDALTYFISAVQKYI